MTRISKGQRVALSGVLILISFILKYTNAAISLANIFMISAAFVSGLPIAKNALSALNIVGVFRKLERSGDHITNIAEEIVFFLDAKVLKHSGKSNEHYL